MDMRLSRIFPANWHTSEIYRVNLPQVSIFLYGFLSIDIDDPRSLVSGKTQTAERVHDHVNVDVVVIGLSSRPCEKQLRQPTQFSAFNQRRPHRIARKRTSTTPVQLSRRFRPGEDCPTGPRTCESPSLLLPGSWDRPGLPAALRPTDPVLPSTPCATIRDGF